MSALSSPSKTDKGERFTRFLRVRSATPSLLLLLVIPLLYLLTLAHSLVLGDPTEYTLVANVLGIAHPPGYAFITLAGKLFQTLIPVGSIPGRMHLLSATSATVAAFFIFGTVRATAGRDRVWWMARGAGLFAALSAATATDIWQHAIHANPHIITATFLVANLFFLSRWWASTDEAGEQERRWLYFFAFSAGLGVTHHPLTVFSFPAYAIFILAVHPQLLKEWRTLLGMVLVALLGLSLFLYYPIRSAMQPVFGPHDMNTLGGFLDHVLARGLSESLPFYGLADQPARLLVFWSLLRLQYPLVTILLALGGLAWLWQQPRRPLFLLYLLAFLSNYAFVINLRVQDIMAYLLGPFMLVGPLGGIGLLGLLIVVGQRARVQRSALALLLAALFLVGPLQQIAWNLPRISLRDYDEGQAYVESVFDYFEGSGEGAVLLHDWEHMTPLWYTRDVEGRWPDPADVRPEFVSTARPWLESVYAYLPGGPVYLNSYRSEIVAAGFRLRPRGPFYQVVEPASAERPEGYSLPLELTPIETAGGQSTASAAGTTNVAVEVVGYQLPQREVTAGDYVPLTLAMSVPVTTTDYFVPVLQLTSPGMEPVSFPFTTDNHLVTPLWRPGEIIVERFDLALPHDLAGGEYRLLLNLENLSRDETVPLNLGLGTLQVTPQENPPSTEHLLANFRQRVGLASARVWSGLETRHAPWAAPLPVAAGDSVHLILKWESLAKAEESYTVFVHLIDGANRPLLTLDYTPLGGAAPTHLWIPKWLPGQEYLDPYRLQLPETLAPGTYLLEVGLYEMTGGRRLLMADATGNLVGDRYILGEIEVR